MAASIRVKGKIAIFSQEEGVWTSEHEPLERWANKLMKWRERTLSHFEEHVDFERTAAEYIIEHCKQGEGEIVHIDPYYDENKTFNPSILDSGA